MATATPLQMQDAVSRFLATPRKLLIDGRWIAASSGKTFDSIDPSTGEVLARVAEGDGADIDLAVKAARRAFAQQVFPGVPRKSVRKMRPLRFPHFRGQIDEHVD